MNAQAPLTPREKIALAVSAAIVLGSIIYWVMQISDVMDTLKTAYGG
jgi:type II secretory pathway component PulM